MNRGRQDSLDRQATAAYCAIGEFIANRRISCSVLSGLDPITGKIGYDLDLYVPDPKQAKEIIAYAYLQFRNHGFPWSSPMHPLWGPRCIGVSADDYGEVHISQVLRFGPCNFSGLVELDPIIGALGLPFDPVLLFLRLVVKRNRAVLRGQPLWTCQEPPSFLVSQQDAIAKRLTNAVQGIDTFIAAILGPDEPANFTKRRQGLLRMIGSAVRNHPLGAVEMTGMYLRRRTLQLVSPCAPYVSVVAPNAERLEKELQRRIGHAFRKIETRSKPWTWRERRMLQSRQSIPVHVATALSSIDQEADVTAIVGDGGGDMNEYAKLTRIILDKTVEMNRKWQEYYAKA